MACRFLENLTLASMIAPFDEGEFLARSWGQAPLVVQRGNADYYDGLFSLRDFDETIAFNPAYVKLANAAANKKTVSYSTEATPGIESLLAEMRDGGTLVLDQMHRRNPNLSLLCRVLGEQLGHAFQTNLYLTPPNGKGFTPHWDNHDVFILQVLGSKHWKIEKTRRELPHPTAHMSSDDRELRGELLDFTLQKGDIAYIPSGFVHAAECGGEASLHITFGMMAVFVESLLVAAVKEAVMRFDHLRRPLPVRFHQAPEKELVTLVQTSLRDIADEAFVTKFVSGFKDELIKKCPLDVSGQVMDFFQPSPIKLADIFGPRRGTFYTLHNEDTGVHVNFGTRSITFPDFFRDALEFALKTPLFAVRELPGDIEDSERIVFVERLQQEGLVVRARAPVA